MPRLFRKAILWLINVPRFPEGRISPSLYAVKSFLTRACGLKVGRGVLVAAHFRCPAEAGENIVIGDHAALSYNVTVLSHAPVTIGKFSRIGTDVTLANGSPGCGCEPPSGRTLSIGDGCWIGSGVRIVGPVTIGDFAVIGAGSVVLSDVPAKAVVFGIPARAIWKRKVPARIWYDSGVYYDSESFTFCSQS